MWTVSSNVGAVRAARLVVDTGMHALGWSRQEAVDYLTDNTPMAPVETDRYVGCPGQALGYLVGRLEIQCLRAEAERALGAGFDIRGFHDVVLGRGVLPLPALETVSHGGRAGAWGRVRRAKRSLTSLAHGTG